MIKFAGIYAIGYGLVWATGQNNVAAGASDEFTFDLTYSMRARHFPEYHAAIDYKGTNYYAGEWIGAAGQTAVWTAAGAPQGRALAMAGRSVADDVAFSILFHENEAHAAPGARAGQIRRQLMAAIWTAPVPDAAIRRRIGRMPDAPGLYAMDNNLYGVAYGGISSVSVRSRLMSAFSGGHDKAYALLQLPGTRLRFVGLHFPNSNTLRWVETELVHSARFFNGNRMLNSVRARYSMKLVPSSSSTPSIFDMRHEFGRYQNQIDFIQDF